MEGRCQNFHMRYIKESHYKYCPWCGVLLVIRLHCDHCQRDFTSDKSYQVHKFNLAIFKNNPCPNSKGCNDHSHSIGYLERRNRMYCGTCKLEYKLQPVGK
jgi:hypothetical protein